MKPGSLFATLAACIGIAGSVGCAGPIQTRYYALADETPASVTTTVAESRYRVAIGPVTLPEAVDRRQMVLRTGTDQYVISDANAWVAPLKSDIPRVVADVAALILPSAQVVAYTQHAGQDADFRVTIDVIRFESTPGESVAFEATWRVGDRTGKLLRESSESYVVPVDAAGIPAVIAAHRKALAALGREIAQALKVLAAAN